jgi:Na+-driven multidrug efflux pump
MRRFAANALYVCGAFAVVITILTVTFTRQLLQLIDVPEEIIDLSYSYIVFVFAGIPAAMGFNILASLLRALGDSKSPLYFLAVSSVINVGLDLLFIIVLDMGVMGVGIATVIAQATSAILCLLYIRRSYPVLHFKKDELPFAPAHCRKIVAMGVPMGLQFSITAIGGLILAKAVNGLNDIAVITSITTGTRIFILTFQPMEALGVTIATFCGQNLGAKRLGRIQTGIRRSLAIQLAYCVVAGVILWFFGRWLAGVFVGSEHLAIMDNVQFQLRVLAIFFFSIAFLLIYRNALQGLGYSFFAMSAGVCELIGRAVVAFVLVGPYGFAGVCFAGPLSWILADLVLIPAYVIVMRRLKKKFANEAVIPT